MEGLWSLRPQAVRKLPLLSISPTRWRCGFLPLDIIHWVLVWPSESYAEADSEETPRYRIN